MSLYQASVPMMIKYCRNFAGLLIKAEEHCASKGTDPADLLSYRLIEDMRPLTYQVQSCSDAAKHMVSRITGVQQETWPDDETTFEQLQARLNKTIELLQSVKPESMDVPNDKEILMVTQRMGTFKFTASDYVYLWAIPYFHFHLTSGYCILRTLGVPIGAFDYIDRDKNLLVKV